MSNIIDLPINFEYGDIVSEAKEIEEPKIFNFDKNLLEKIAASINIPVDILKMPYSNLSQYEIYFMLKHKTKIAQIRATTSFELSAKEALFSDYLKKRRPDLFAMIYGFQAQNRKLRGRESIKINRRRVRLIRSIKNV